MNDAQKKIDRRMFLRHSASVLAFNAATFVLSSTKAEELRISDDPMRVPGVLPRPYGTRSPFENLRRSNGDGPRSARGWSNNASNNVNSLTPLQALHGIVTPSALHFERHHNGVPTIDP